MKAKAGRKPLPEDIKRKQVNVRLPPYIINHLREMEDDYTTLIERAIIKTYKIKKEKR